MKKNKFTFYALAFGLIILGFTACDKDFANLESDIINNDIATNFDILSKPYDVITYNEVVGPVQTNGLGINMLGFYNDVYGKTTSSFVTQLALTTFDPEFGEGVAIDSVVLTLPYFSVATDIDEEGNISYDIDSVIGRKPIKLSLFESDYFIRNFDPNGEFNDSQAYFSDKSASTNEMFADALEAEELIMLTGLQTSHVGGNEIKVNDDGFVLEEPDTEDDEDTDPQITQRLAPGIRIKLDPTFWQNKIIAKEGDAVLSSQNNFSEYFRGLYFKAEAFNDDGSFIILNAGATNANIVIYYTRLDASTTDDEEDTEQATYELAFGPNTINFFDNDFTIPIENSDPIIGDSRIYLKGGDGSIARIKLFNGDDIDDQDDMTFENWKNFYVETDADGAFVKSKLLVNEANLVFYVDQSLMQDGEPERIYLYDIENKTPLVDYFLDANIGSLPSLSIINHLGPLQRVDDNPDQNGIKYKLKITEHINNLLLRDSTNVELGLAVSLNVNLEEFFLQREVLDTNDSDLTVPISSVISPRGTVLHGNNTEDAAKKVYLEIYYTCPEGEDCE